MAKVVPFRSVVGKVKDALEKKYDGQFREVFGALRLLLTEKEKPRRAIGFRPGRV